MVIFHCPVKTSDALAEPSFTKILTFISLTSFKASFEVLIASLSLPFQVEQQFDLYQ